MFALLSFFFISSVLANTCAIVGRSNDCHGNCEEYCLKNQYCELDHTVRSTWPWSSAFCGLAWQAKCVCRTCPSGFCGKVRFMIEQAIPIARKHVQKRIDHLTASIGETSGAGFTGVRPKNYPNVLVVDAGFATQDIEQVRAVCEARGRRLVSLQDASHLQYLKEQLQAQKGESYFVSGMGTAVGYMYQRDHHVYDLNDPQRSLDHIFKDAMIQGILHNNEADSNFHANQPWAGFGWGGSYEIHDYDDNIHHAIFCEEAPRADYGDFISTKSCQDYEPKTSICDGGLKDCWEAGMNFCNSDDKCFGVMLHEKWWTKSYRGVMLCLSDVMVDQTDNWITRMKSNGDNFLVPSSCTASSEYSSDYRCHNAYENNYNPWATSGQGVGSWIEYDFGTNVVIRRIEFQNRMSCNTGASNCYGHGNSKSASLIFDNSVHHTFNVQDRYGVNNKWIPGDKGVVTRKVKFRIDSVYNTDNNGAQILRFYGYGKARYGKFAEGVVPYHEGGSLGSVKFSNADDCKAWCDRRSNCKSFARCDDNQHCWFKDLKLTGKESARNIGRCTTYYKPDFESPNDGWRPYFGNRNNHIRKPFMLNVLQNMKRYLGDIGYSANNKVQLIAKPAGIPARMACNKVAPCHGAEERRWPHNIGFWVDTVSESLISDTTVHKVAALMIHELTHSTTVASRSNLAVTGSDIPLTEANVNGHQNAHFLATRDWTYDGGEIARYATCYESGHNCPGANTERPSAIMAWDVPLNNAASYENWIFKTEGSCVSGDMVVESESRGPIKTGALVKGMKIRGKDAKGNSAWCTVQDIYFNGMGTLFGNFTEGHLVLDDSSGIVLPSGNSSHEHFGARYTIFTDCPVMENKDGDLFTPLAQTFCGAREFSWNEYLVLWRAIQQVVSDTGMFWFHLDETFSDCKDESLCGNVTHWRDALPPVCESMMACATSQDDVICDDFEEVAQSFFDKHIRAERVEEIKNAYADYGSISHSVKVSSDSGEHLWMWVAIVAGGFALIMAILLLTWRCCCKKKQDDVDEVVVV